MDHSIEDISLAGHNRTYKSTENSPLQPDKVIDTGFNIVLIGIAILISLISFALSIQLYFGEQQVSEHGSVVSDNKECTNVGEQILKNGGNAVDAAVAVTFCMAVVSPHLTGLGGGGVYLAYDHRYGKISDCLDFQPGYSSSLSTSGIPGFVLGLFQAHTNSGFLSWRDVLQPAITLATSGFSVTESLVSSLKLINNQNGELYSWISSIVLKNNTIQPLLGQFLNEISEQGSNAFYNDHLNDLFTPKEISSFSVNSGNCITQKWNSFDIFMTGLGTGGFQFMNFLKELNLINYLYDEETTNTILSMRDFEKEQLNFPSGVVVNVMDKKDLYVSIVSGLGTVLGSQKLIKNSYILNNAPSVGNKLENNHYTSSSLAIVVSPELVCGARYVLGGSDFRDVAQVLVPLLTTKTDIQTVVEGPRVRLKNNTVYLEDNHAPSLSKYDVEMLSKEGLFTTSAPQPYPSLNLIEKTGDIMNPYADSRGHGKAVVF